MEYKLMLAGFGGQGVLSAGRIVATAGLLSGREVSWLPSYGPEMRGGTANCSVIIADQAIGSPILNELDALLALNAPSQDKFVQLVKPGGLVIADSTLVKAVPTRQDIRYQPLPAAELAAAAGNMTFAAIVLLGCLQAADGCFSREDFEKALFEALPSRHHHLIPLEMDLFDQGAAFWQKV